MGATAKNPEPSSSPQSAGDCLALGLATTTAMWTVGYLCRMPGAAVPAPVILALVLVLPVAGGFLAAARTRRGRGGGLKVGLIAGAFNLLILGSLGSHLTTDQRIAHYALFWGPISMALCGLLALLGATVGRRFNPARRQYLDGPAALTLTTTLATLVLVMAGGMVTGMNAGLSVPDWPDTFRYNLFLFPLSHMTGDVFFEHTHRLLGTLVGLAVFVQAVFLWRCEQRREVKWLAALTVAMIGVQGLLGGLRVTGYFTGAQTAAAMAPSTTLAVVHGVFGQLCFAAVAVLAAFCSRRWRIVEPQTKNHEPQTTSQKPETRNQKPETFSAGGPSGSAAFGLLLNWTLVATLVLQLTLGSILRHVGHVLVLHVTVAVFVLVLAFFAGIRAWALYTGEPVLERLGIALLLTVSLQVLLGIGAVIAIGGQGPLRHPDFPQALVTTIHQTTGAILLVLATLLAVWSMRLPPSATG